MRNAHTDADRGPASRDGPSHSGGLRKLDCDEIGVDLYFS